MKMRAIRVDKNVPLPRRAIFDAYPFGSMEIGDSFVVSEDEIKRVRNAAHWYGKFNEPAKFKTRRIKPDEPIFRCWRVR
jgi:hypothetical protein